MFNKVLSLAALSVMIFAGCSESDGFHAPQTAQVPEIETQEKAPKATTGGPIELDHVDGGEPLLASVLSFCELVDRSPRVSNYLVKRIVTNLGDDPSGRLPDKIPLTYVEFTHVDDLVGSGVVPTLTMKGGVWPDGSVTPSSIEFTVGEEIVLFFGDAKEALPDGNRRVGVQQVFRKTEAGGFTNGVLLGREVYDLDRLERMLIDSHTGECLDVRPDAEIDRERAVATEEEGETPVTAEIDDSD